MAGYNKATKKNKEDLHMSAVNISRKNFQEEVLNSDNYMFGGKGNLNNKIMKTSQYQENDEIQNYFNIKLPANGAVVLKKVARK